MAEFERIAYFDEITNLPNLIKFKIDMGKMFEKYPDKQFIIVKFDILNFKAINEMFDFHMGNKVLQKVAETSDFIDNEYFIKARVGSDEFLLLGDVELFGDLEKTTQIYEDIFVGLIPEMHMHKFEFRYGRYIIEPGEKDINTIISKVNMAHSFTRISDKEKIIDYNDSFKQSVIRFTEITNKMQKALENKEFKLYLQPKMRILDEKIVGAEALVRWIESDGMMTYPNDFIPLFEKNGFILNLDMYMFESACELVRRWLDEGRECYPIAVNFSRLNLGNTSFVNQLNKIVSKYDIDKKYVEIELTETLIAGNEFELKSFFEELNSEGFVVSIDDFGAGQSSLGMIKNYKADTLKLDRSFLVDNENDERGGLVVSGIIKLAHNLEMNTVAEGVEKREQLEMLQTIDCYAAQGYFFSKPLQIKDFEEKYLTSSASL